MKVSVYREILILSTVTHFKEKTNNNINGNTTIYWKDSFLGEISTHACFTVLNGK